MATDAPALPVIVNSGGGAARRAGGDLRQRIERAFAAAGQAIALELVEGDEMAAALERRAPARRLVVGGGDGTIGTAAEAVARGGGELAVLPLGTRNHFARALDIPLDLDGAARLAASGAARRVDLGEAAGRVFVNNVSAGAYVELVRAREASPLPKALANLTAAFAALRRLRARTFDLRIDGEAATVATPLLLVGNNRYEVSQGRPGERRSLEDARLSCYAVAPLSRSALAAAALRMLAGRPRMHRDFALDRLACEIRIEGPGASLDVALDGERMRFDLPLSIRIRPRALAVVAPPESSRTQA